MRTILSEVPCYDSLRLQECENIVSLVIKTERTEKRSKICASLLQSSQNLGIHFRFDLLSC